MKFSKKKEERKQDKQPVAQAMSDDRLMGVTGGTVYYRRVRAGKGRKPTFWVEVDRRRHTFWSATDAVAFAESHGQSTELVDVPRKR